MSLLTSRRARSVAATASAAVLVTGASLVASATPAFAADMTITSVSPTKVAATLANRVITITGTNFDEDSIASITVGGDADCASLTSYVVTSPTTISVKTPGNGTNTASVPGCAASSGGTAEPVTITASSTGGANVTKASAVTFVPPPSVATASSSQLPVITENSSEVAVANQVQALNAVGGQTIRIRAGADFAFSGAGTAGLSGTLGGKPLSTVGFLSSTGATQANSAAGDNANYWIAKTGTGLTASTTPELTITQNTVSRTFATAATGLTIVATPTVTSLDVQSGKTNGSTTVKITGTGFSATTTDNTVTFCGASANVTAATTTLLTVTTPTVSSTAGTTPGLGTATAGVCPVVVTKGGVASPVTSTSFFAFVDR